MRWDIGFVSHQFLFRCFIGVMGSVLIVEECVVEHAFDFIYNTAHKDVFVEDYWLDNKYLNIYFKRVNFAFEFNCHMVDNNH